MTKMTIKHWLKPYLTTFLTIIQDIWQPAVPKYRTYRQTVKQMLLSTSHLPNCRDLDVIGKILVKSADCRQRFNTCLERRVNMISGVERWLMCCRCCRLQWNCVVLINGRFVACTTTTHHSTSHQPHQAIASMKTNPL